jgi:N-acyl amino acid synthase FeeM
MAVSTKVLEKRIGLCKRMGLFGAAEAGVTVTRAISASDLEAAYRLVHDVFAEKGYIDAMDGGIRLRAFEGAVEMATFIARDGDQVVAVMSIVPDHPDFGLPSDEAFREEIGALRNAGRRVCEITNLAVKGEYRRSSAFTDLTRACFAQARAWHSDDIFIAISPGHAMFFEGVLQFDACGDQRSYSADKMDVVEGKRLDLHEVDSRWADVDRALGDAAFLSTFYYDSNPYHDLVVPWAEQAKRAFLTVGLLRRLFVDCSGILHRCGDDVLEVFRRTWGNELFSRVSGQPARQAPVELEVTMSC